MSPSNNVSSAMASPAAAPLVGSSSAVTISRLGSNGRIQRPVSTAGSQSSSTRSRRTRQPPPAVVGAGSSPRAGPSSKKAGTKPGARSAPTPPAPSAVAVTGLGLGMPVAPGAMSSAALPSLARVRGKRASMVPSAPMPMEPTVAPAAPSSPASSPPSPPAAVPSSSTSASRLRARRAKRAAQVLAPREEPAGGQPAPAKLDLDLLLAKIIHYCHEYVPDGILAAVDRHQPAAQQTPWVTSPASAARPKRFFVLDARTWKLTPYATAAAAQAEARRSPGIDAGNGVLVYYKEHAAYVDFMKGFAQGQREEAAKYNAKKKRGLSLPALRNPDVVRAEMAQRMLAMKERAGVAAKSRDGSPLFLLVCGALDRIKAGKV